MSCRLSALELTLVLAAVLGGTSAPAQPTTPLSIVQLAALPNTSESIASSINNRGEVGGFVLNDSGYHAVLWRGRAITVLPSLGGGGSASDINDKGQIVGDSATASYEEDHAVLWENGAIADLGTLGGHFSTASSINNRGEIVGRSAIASGEEHAFLWKDGVMVDLGTLPGGSFSSAEAINNRGQAVGQSNTSSGDTHAVLWEDGTIVDLGTVENDTNSGALDINNRGQVVGWSTGGEFGDRAFVYENGAMTALGGYSSQANGINDSGTIVGQILTSSFDLHAALWRDGTVIDLGTLPTGIWSGASDVNNRGRVVGGSMERVSGGGDFSDFTRAVLWQK